MKRVLISDNIWDFDLSATLQEISEQRREQALKFKHEQGQRLCVLAYQLLKQALCDEYGITDNPLFAYNESGKPSLVGHPEIFFNLIASVSKVLNALFSNALCDKDLHFWFPP